VIVTDLAPAARVFEAFSIDIGPQPAQFQLDPPPTNPPPGSVPPPSEPPEPDPLDADPGSAPDENPPAATPTLSCPNLHLELGPLELDLLGMALLLDRVVLDLEALPGSSESMRNSLCALTSGGGVGTVPLDQTARVLNRLLRAMS
jgi:hypothetical protein